MKTIKTYNDGVAEVYTKKDQTRNVRSLDDLDYVGYLYFAERSKRMEDIDFAEQQGAQLTLKIVTPDDGRSFDTDGNVVIGNMIYSIINIDHDRANNELYFYLEEVRQIER